MLLGVWEAAQALGPRPELNSVFSCGVFEGLYPLFCSTSAAVALLYEEHRKKEQRKDLGTRIQIDFKDLRIHVQIFAYTSTYINTYAHTSTSASMYIIFAWVYRYVYIPACNIQYSFTIFNKASQRVQGCEA